MKKRMGVPVGYKIPGWKYVGRWRESKISPGKWKFKFDATKQRKANTYGGIGKGTIGKWRINAVQVVRKTDKGRYQTSMIGIKKSLGFKIKH